jgi:PAS domain S-box-containing protein
MSLGQKTFAIVVLTVVGLMAALYFTTRFLILRSFQGLEQTETRSAVERAQNALNDDLSSLTATANDYAAWDRIYGFMLHPSSDIAKQEFQDDTLQGLSLNSILLMDLSGKIVFSESFDFLQKQRTEFPLRTQMALAADRWVRQAAQSSVPVSGILPLPQGPVLISACPILTSQRKGPVRGVLVMTRDLDQARVNRLTQVTRSLLTIVPYSGSQLPLDFRRAQADLEVNHQTIAVQPLSEGIVGGYILLKDVHNEPILWLKLTARRTVFQQGVTSLHYFLGSLCVVSVAFGGMTLLLLRTAVLNRLSYLSSEVERVGERNDLSERVAFQGNDEVASLGRAINGMLEALQKSDMHFRQIAENIHQVFWVKDAASEKLAYISPAYESIWGRTREELRVDPQSWRSALHREDREIVAEMLKLQKRGRAGTAEYRVVRPDGSERWIYDRYFPVCNQDGRLTQIVGLAEDITEFRRAKQVLLRSQEELEELVRERTSELARTNESLHTSEERSRQLFATIPVPVWLYDLATLRFLEVNDAAVEHYGYSRVEFLQMTVESIRPVEDLGRHRGDLSQPGPEKSVSTGWKHRTKDGRLIDVEISSLLVQVTGAPAVLVAIQDVTDRIRMEIELRLGQKLQAVGELAAGVAHEINTPMQFVGDNVRFLQDAFAGLFRLLEKHEEIYDARGNSYPLELQEQVKAARASADLQFLRAEIPLALDQTSSGVESVTTIVRALKKFSHVDRGREKATADLNDAIESTLIVARNELKYVADVETVFANLPPVLCHLGDLNQVFLNLLVNAAHAITDVVKQTAQKGRIRVETKTDGEFVVVSIGDTGAGIPEGIRDRIFEPFFTTKQVGKGTGQGLALARAIIVEKHGGSLTFASEMGKGTTFSIRIPINGVEDGRPSSGHSEAPSESLQGPVSQAR